MSEIMSEIRDFEFLCGYKRWFLIYIVLLKKKKN